MTGIDNQMRQAVEDGRIEKAHILNGDIKRLQEEIDRQYVRLAEWTDGAQILSTFKTQEGNIAQLLKVFHGKRPQYLWYVPDRMELAKVELKTDDDDDEIF